MNDPRGEIGDRSSVAARKDGFALSGREMIQRLAAPADDDFLGVQSGGFGQRVRVLPREIVEGAYIGYDVMGHASNQTLARLQQRAGFGIGEIGYYLAFAVMSGRVKLVWDERERELLDRPVKT